MVGEVIGPGGGNSSPLSMLQNALTSIYTVTQKIYVLTRICVHGVMMMQCCVMEMEDVG